MSNIHLRLLRVYTASVFVLTMFSYLLSSTWYTLGRESFAVVLFYSQIRTDKLGQLPVRRAR